MSKVQNTTLDCLAFLRSLSPSEICIFRSILTAFKYKEAGKWTDPYPSRALLSKMSKKSFGSVALFCSKIKSRWGRFLGSIQRKRTDGKNSSNIYSMCPILFKVAKMLDALGYFKTWPDKRDWLFYEQSLDESFLDRLYERKRGSYEQRFSRGCEKKLVAIKEHKNLIKEAYPPNPLKGAFAGINAFRESLRAQLPYLSDSSFEVGYQLYSYRISKGQAIYNPAGWICEASRRGFLGKPQKTLDSWEKGRDDFKPTTNNPASLLDSMIKQIYPSSMKMNL